MKTRKGRFFPLLRNLRIEPLESRQLLASLSLGISPSSVSEAAGAGAATGTVIRDLDDLSDPLEVTLASSDTTAATVPNSVTIPANQTSATFPVDAVDDSFVDGTQAVEISATANLGGAGGTPTPDTTFGSAGTVATALRNNIWPQRLDIEIQSDGKILAIGRHATAEDTWHVVRLNPDGSYDSTFGTDGIVDTVFSGESLPRPTDIIQHGDGRITVVGDSQSNWLLARYNSDGSPDTTFDSDGQATLQPQGSSSVYKGVLNDDGSIFLVGHGSGLVLAKLGANGSLDGTFGTSGIVSPEFDPAGTEVGYNIAQRPDGKMVVSGLIYTGGDRQFFAARFNADGTVDTSFNGDGYQTIDLGYQFEKPYALALQADGRIVLAGTVSSTPSGDGDWGVARLNADGTLDTSFNGDGIDVIDFNGLNDEAWDVLIQEDGSILVVGGSALTTVNYERTAVRYLSDGTPDPSFGTNGQYVFPPLPERQEQIFAAALQDDGKLIALTGFVSTFQVERHVLPTTSILADSQTLDVTDDDTPTLTLTINPASISEADGAAATTGTVSRNFDMSEPMVVSLTSSDTSEATVPASVTIPAGDVSADFDIDAVNDTEADGTQTVTVTGQVGISGPLVWDDTFGGGGTVDQTFGTNAVTVLSDGKILSVGYEYFPGRAGNYHDFGISRRHPDGSLDTTFGNGGYVYSDITGESDIAEAVVVQADGKFVVGGRGFNGPEFDWIVSRYLPDGALDTSFGVNGIFTIDLDGSYNEIFDLALQPDGKIIVAGLATPPGSPEGEATVARLNSDGTLDATFGTGGFATVPDTGRGFGVALQQDGKIVFTGVVHGGNFDSTFFVARFSTGGVLDSAFGTGGKVLTDLPGWYDEGYDVAVQPDGKIVVVGDTKEASPGTNAHDFAILRYQADGALDGSFGTGGVVTSHFSGDDVAARLVLDQDGAIVVAGRSTSDRSPLVARYNPDGSLRDSIVSPLVGVTPNDIAIDAGGDFIVASDTSSGLGVLQRASGNQAVVAFDTVDVTDDDPDAPITVTINPSSISEGDGAGAATGTVTRGGDTTDPLVVKLSSNDTSEATVPATVTIPAGEGSADFEIDAVDDAMADGTQTVEIRATAPAVAPGGIPQPDTSFGTAGVVTTTLKNSVSPQYLDIEVQADGKIIAIGSDAGATDAWNVVRLNPDGSSDASFGLNGEVTSTFPGETWVRPFGIVQHDDGRITILGEAGNAWLLARYNPDGSPDTTFSGDGQTILAPFPSTRIYEGLANDDESVFVVGERFGSPGHMILGKVKADGTLDTSFGSGGIVSPALTPGGNERIYDIVRQPDGRLVVGGKVISSASNYQFLVARFETDGTLDTSFDGDGYQTIDLGYKYQEANSLALQPDGRIVLSGWVGTSDFSSENWAVARVNVDGTVDTSFSGDGFDVIDFAGLDDRARDVVAQEDGKILVVGGAFVAPNGYERAFLRYNPDGSLDSSFGTGGRHVLPSLPETFEETWAAALQSDGKLVAFSGFSTNYRVERYVLPAMPLVALQTLDVTDDDTAELTVTIDPASISEGDGAGATTGTVARNTDTTNALVVTLSSSNTDEAAVPATVTIPAGQSSATFPIDAVDDAILDGTQVVNITAAVYDPELDTTFGNGGVALAAVELNDVFNELDLALQADGKLLTLGDDSDDANAWRLARLNADGSPDTTFGTGGAVATQFPNSTGGRPYAMAIQPDGKIVVVGSVDGGSSSWFDWGMARYTATGQLDTIFGTGGLVRMEFSGEGRSLVDVDLALDGSILVAGTSNRVSMEYQLARFLTDGTLDTTFGTGGIVIEDLGPTNNADQAHQVNVQSDGKILLAGKATDGSGGVQFAVYRFDADGTRDLTFSSDGLQTIYVGDDDVYDVQDLLIQPDGRILLAGFVSTASDSDGVVLRLNTDGSLDMPFADGGGMVFNAGDSTVVRAMSLDGLGRIYLSGGLFAGANFFTELVTFRLTSAGAFDTTFDNDGLAVFPLPPEPDQDNIYTTRFQPDGLLAVLFVSDGDVGLARFGMGPAHAPGQAQLSVTDDDLLPEIEFSAPSYQFTEADDWTSLITLTRTGNTGGTSQVRVEITGGTATGGVDFGAFSFPMTVTFAANETSKTVDLLVGDDPWNEPDEDVDFRVTAVSNAAIRDQDTTSFVILDNDPLALYVEIDRDEMAEQIGTSTATAYRNTFAGELTVDLESSDTTEATVPATVTFADGSNTAPFTITAKDDDEQDGTKTVTVTAREPGFVDGADTIDVTDDESPGFAPGNLWVTTYPFGDESQVSEYTLTGTLLQDIDINHSGESEICDIVVGQDLLVNIYAGTWNPVFARLQAATKVLQEYSIPGLTTGGNVTYGGIAALRQFAFLSDDGNPGGIVRIDTSDSTFVRFADTYDITDVSIGHDGLLYGLDNTSGPDRLHVFDPYSLAQLRTINLPAADHRGIAVDARGDLFFTEWRGDVYHYDPAGIELNRLDTGPNSLGDIDLRADGTLAIGSYRDGIFITDVTLADVSNFDVVDDSGMHFVAFTDPLEFPTPGLALTIVDAEVAEGGAGSLVTVTRNTEPIGDLVVELSSGDADQVAMPSEITIPAGDVAVTFTVTATDDPLLDGTQTVALTARATGYAEDADTVDVLDDDMPLAVTSLVPTPSGFRVQFNRPFASAELNLYDVEAGIFGPADVTLIGGQVGRIAGSLVLGTESLVFLATGGPLPADDYTVTLRSAANGLKDLANDELLDGDDNGLPGGDYMHPFTVAAAQSVVVALPDFTRGPGQEVHVPPVEVDDGDDNPGLPLWLNDAAGITSVELTIQYDPELLTIDGAAIGPYAPNDATLNADLSVPGLVTINFSTTTALSAGPAEFITLSANVPSTATAGAAHVLDITVQSVNGGTVSATVDDAIHLVGLFGDATGNGEYSGLDAQHVARVAVGLDGGFEALPCVDPVVAADVTGNGELSGLDAQRIAQEVVGLDPPEIPPLPQPLRLSLPRVIASDPEGEAPAEPQSSLPIGESLVLLTQPASLDATGHDVRAARVHRSVEPTQSRSAIDKAGLNIPHSALRIPNSPTLLTYVLDEIEEEEDATWEQLALTVSNIWDEATDETRMKHG